MKRRVVVLGSTGTIGKQTLDVIDRVGDRLETVALAGNRNVALLAEQALRHAPAWIAVGDARAAEELAERLRGRWSGEIVSGPQGLLEVVSVDAEIVVNALVGAAGLRPSLTALRLGRTLALANKESLVVAGEILARAATTGKGRLLPIDSEHSGLFQCLEGRDRETLRRVILTASGGPFRTWPLESLSHAKLDEALNHPTWKMGPRITIDSATMLNKGFEIHEARWLFDLPPERIDVWIHPQSIVHAIVEFVDGSMLAQLSATDMRLPIMAALTYPERPSAGLPRCDLTQAGRLDFEPVDPRRYPCLEIARRALETGGTAPAALNGADEVLVAAFRDRRIRFNDIASILERVLDEHRSGPAETIEIVLEADAWARDAATRILDRS